MEGGEGNLFFNFWCNMVGQQNMFDKVFDLVFDVQIFIEDIFQKVKVFVQFLDGKMLCVVLLEGVIDGKQVCIVVQGYCVSGLKCGDVVVIFCIVLYFVFRVDGFDFYMNLLVDIENVVFGCEIIVDVFDGLICVIVLEWLGFDWMLWIRGCGLLGCEGECGDFYVEICVMFWDYLDDKVKDLMCSLCEGLFL